MLTLLRLRLTQFRSYERLSWHPAARLSVITGPNGSGKTNLLEAVSLLAPGRGLRGARMSELARHGGDGRWGVAARIASTDGESDLGTGAAADPASDRRVFRLDGSPPQNQAEVARRFAAVWLTPQMDRLFQEGTSGRRRFLDRLVWALEPGQAREVAAHDHAMTQRNRLLATGGDPGWLSGLEDTMARHAVAASAARAGLVSRLNAVLAGPSALGAFPAAVLGLSCPIADRLAAGSALDAEDWLRATLAARRGEDRAAGSAGVGAHRADMTLADLESGRPAALASTGEQKALLIAVVLGHASLIAQARGSAPLLLLDEPAVHLDAGRRQALFAALAALPGQALLTGTDSDAFSALHGLAEGLRSGEGGLVPDPAFMGAGPRSGGLE